ncbi:13E12 repeat family protein, partial [Mycobacterium tuberculosis M1545]
MLAKLAAPGATNPDD